jgi:regulator of PEP synthase PpsR (kinase-PPPase family)
LKNESSVPVEIEQTSDEEISLKPPNLSVFVISGGVGASGEQLARTVLAQFPNAQVQIELFPKIYRQEQVREILQQAVDKGAVVAHTFVDHEMRLIVHKIANELNLNEIDLVGPLMETLAEKLNTKPLGKPGLYRQLYKSYFDRIQAINFSLDHDDGKNRDGWAQAEIILLGASRVGKTPLSLYLSILGWKVANVPLVSGVHPHASLFDLGGPQLVGLTIAPSELIEHREHRQRNLGTGAMKSDYTDPLKVFEELEAIEKNLKRARIPLVDVTGKPIESSADEVIQIVRRRRKLNAI